LGKILLIPIHYTFAQNLALLISTKIQEVTPIKLILLGLSLVNLLIIIVLFFKKDNRYVKFLIFMMVFPILLTILFSYLIFSIFGLRSILIFSIPFYLLIGKSISSHKQLVKIYLIFSLIAIISTLFFFIKKPLNEFDYFLLSNMKQNDLILHSEITSFYYFSYKHPEFYNRAAINSLYTNEITMRTLGYNPVNINSLYGQSFWLIEVIPSPLHEKLVFELKNNLKKTHQVTQTKLFDNMTIYRYQPNSDNKN